MRPDEHSTTRRTHRPTRRAIALADVLIGGMLLAIGLTGVLTLCSRALLMQKRAENQVIAAALIDQTFGMILVEGPFHYSKSYDLYGAFDYPFEDFEFDLDMKEQGAGQPYIVSILVRHRLSGQEFEAETMIAERAGEEPYPDRQPEEPLDREARYDELLQ